MEHIHVHSHKKSWTFAQPNYIVYTHTGQKALSMQQQQRRVLVSSFMTAYQLPMHSLLGAS